MPQGFVAGVLAGLAKCTASTIINHRLTTCLLLQEEYINSINNGSSSTSSCSSLDVNSVCV